MAKTAKLIITGDIGNDPFAAMFGGETFSAKDCANFLKANKSASTIEVEIHSNGGNVDEGFDIHDQLVNSGKKIITKAFKASSIATVIFLAGKERLISDNATMVIHPPAFNGFPMTRLTKEELEKMTEEIGKTEKKMLDFYKDKLSLDSTKWEEFESLFKEETDLGSDKAIEFGLATGLMEEKQALVYSRAMAALYESKIQNTNKMEKAITEKISGLEKMIKGITEKLSGKSAKKPDKVAGSLPLEDGTMIWFDGETIEVGTACFEDEAMTEPLSDGDYVLEDGRTIVVAEGLVTEIKEAEPADEPPAEDKKTMEAMKKKIEALEKKNKELETASKKATDAVTKATAQLEIISKVIPEDRTNRSRVMDDNTPKWKRALESSRSIREMLDKKAKA